MMSVQDEWPGLCPRCGTARLYSAVYDATFCPTDDTWAESGCDDPTCDFCAQRPARPSEVEYLDVQDPHAD